MKRFLVFILFLILIPTLYAQWEWVNPKPQGNYLWDFYLFNPETILAVGEYGNVIKSTNKGLDWTFQTHTANSRAFYSVGFKNYNSGFAIGVNGDIYETINAGNTWNKTGSFGTPKYSIIFIDSLLGFACGYGSDIFKTLDGGLIWSPKTTPINGSFYSMHFYNSNIGWAAGDYGILKTMDGGENWFLQNVISNSRFFSIAFVNDLIGIATGLEGWDGVIVKTINGGYTWYEVYRETNNYVSSVIMLDQNNYFAVCDSGSLLKSMNGGGSWIKININCSETLRNIKFIGNNIFIIGDNGIVLCSTDNGNSWNEITKSVTRNTLRSMAKINESLLWIVGDNGTILHSSNSGETWINQISGISENLQSVDFVDQNRGWAVGLNGVIISTSNAGNTWQIQQFLATRNFRKIDFYDSQFGLTVGDNGTIFKTTNGGNTWIDRTAGSFDMADVYISDYNTAWILYSDWNTNTGKVIKSTDQGDTWNLVGSIPTYYGMNCIYFVTNQLGFAGTNNGIYKTTNGGVNWTHNGGGVHIYDISFIDNNIGWACGRDGSIYKTNDGGNNWITFYYFNERATNKTLYSILATSGLKAFACGIGGVIIKTANAAPTPVELMSFTALMRLNKVQLNWETSTELNNQGFEIQREFENSDWATIGYRKGKGTSTEPTSYFYEDDISEISVTKILYRLKQIDFDGTVSYSDQVEVVAQPFSFALLQNYPNPFNPSTTIAYSIPQKSNVSLKIYDIVGKEIATLVNEQKEEGTYNIQFDASRLSSGVYIYSIQAGDFLESRKMILMK